MNLTKELLSIVEKKAKGEYFAEFDDKSGMWCVFHTDKKPGHAYASLSDEEQAKKIARELNTDDELKEDVEVPSRHTQDLAHENSYKMGFRHGVSGERAMSTQKMLIPTHVDAYKAGYKDGAAKSIPVKVKEDFKEGDKVKVLSGKHKGKTGQIKSVNAGECRVDLDDGEVTMIDPVGADGKDSLKKLSEENVSEAALSIPATAKKVALAYFKDWVGKNAKRDVALPLTFLKGSDGAYYAATGITTGNWDSGNRSIFLKISNGVATKITSRAWKAVGGTYDKSIRESLNEDAGSTLRTAEQLEVGDDVVITGKVNFEGATGKISRFGRDKKFVVVKLNSGGEHSFHSSDVSEIEPAEAEEPTSQAEKTKFYVAFYDENEERSWIGVISKEHGGKWHEKAFAGKPDYRWGKSYMSYLTPDDIMGWIHKDYSRQVEIEGPFFEADEAKEHVTHNWGKLPDSVSEALKDGERHNDYLGKHFGFENSNNAAKAKKALNAAEIKFSTDKNAGIHYFYFDTKKDMRAAIKVVEKVIDKSKESEWGVNESATELDEVAEPTHTVNEARGSGASKEDIKKLFKPYSIERFTKKVNGETVRNIKTKLRGSVPQDQKKFVDYVEGLGFTMTWSNEANGYIVHESLKESVCTNYADWKQSVLLSHPTQAKQIKFRGKMVGEKTVVSAVIPGEEKVYGEWDETTESGKIISEGDVVHLTIGTDERTGKKYKFNRKELLGLGLTDAYEKDLKSVADILASNVEDAKIGKDGFVKIERDNFNDGFNDVIAELTGKSDEEDDNE